jgi:hypothetical protein
VCAPEPPTLFLPIPEKEWNMYSEDLDGTLACLMEAADSLVCLEDEPIPAELQSGFVVLQTRINSLVTFAEAYQRRVAQHNRAIRRVKGHEPEFVEEDDDVLERPATADAAILAEVASIQ